MCTAFIGYTAVLLAVLQIIALTLKKMAFRDRVVPNFSLSWMSTNQAKSIDVEFDRSIFLSSIEKHTIKSKPFDFQDVLVQIVLSFPLMCIFEKENLRAKT